MLHGMDAALMALDLATLQTRLSEATLALHNLAIGERIVSVQLDKNNGRRTEFSEVNIDKLKAYIADLQNAISAKQVGSAFTRPPIHVTF